MSSKPMGLCWPSIDAFSRRPAASLRAFARRTRLRADSALAVISDAEFQEGQDAIELAAAHEQLSEPVIETIELLVFSG